MPKSPDGRWTVAGSRSELTIMAQDNSVKSRATFAGEEHIDLMWAPDSSIFTISFIDSIDPAKPDSTTWVSSASMGTSRASTCRAASTSFPEIFEWLRATGPSAGRLTVHASWRTARSWAAMAG